MRAIIKCSAIVLALTAVTPANAKGWTQGDLIGGVAGHYTVHRTAWGRGGLHHIMKRKSALRWSEKEQSIRLRAMAKIASSSAGELQRKCESGSDDNPAHLPTILEPLSHE